MIQSPKKIYVSYLGGCAGDMITACLNRHEIKLNSRGTVVDQGSSLKPQEPLHNTKNLLDISHQKNPRFLSTHEFALLRESPVNWINIVATDPDIQEILILRQMTLQKLRIRVNENSHWYKIVKTFCLKGKHDLAAKYWLHQARTIWLTEMQHRLNLNMPNVQRIVVDHLFDKTFVSNFQKQVPTVNLEILKANHALWLSQNVVNRWNPDDTVTAMSYCLQSMDWHQSTGTIQCAGLSNT